MSQTLSEKSARVDRTCAGSEKSSAQNSVADRDLNALNHAEGHLQEAGSELAKGVDIPRAEKAVIALAIGLPGETGALEGALGSRGDRVAAADEPHVAAEDALQHWR